MMASLSDDDRGLDALRRDYLGLMKRCVSGIIYPDTWQYAPPPGPDVPEQHRLLYQKLRQAGFNIVREVRFDPEKRKEGRDWPGVGYTMIGLQRLDNVEQCAERVLRDKVPGDFCETGVWRGGTVIFLRAILRAYECADRVVWACDSFQGMPKPNSDLNPLDKKYDASECDYLAVSLDQVKANFERFGLLDGQVRFLEGWFRDTLPSAPIERLALLRLDGDLYESTTDALTSLYDRVSPGGFILVDDYGDWETCRAAVDDFRAQRSIKDPIEWADWSGIYWRKTE